MKYEAYWISPDGKIVPAEDGAISHIGMILKKPEFFGYTKEGILDLHKKHGDRLGQEGKAREEILKELLDKGWMRIRYVPRQQMFTLQTNSVASRRKQDLIWDWAEKVTGGELDKLPATAYTVFFSTSKPEEMKQLTLKQVLSGAVNESRRTPRATVVHLMKR
jgi:hypothetical protein